jgi:hypothetical protein
MKATQFQSMHTHCVRYMPIARAAPRVRSSVTPRVNGLRSLALQLPFLQVSESMGNHDSKIVDAASVD